MARAKTEGPTSQYPYLNPEGSLTKLAAQQLKNPFDPADVYWKPTDVKNNECLALAYADKRTYEERLDQVFGPQNWSVEVEAFASPYRKVKKAKRKDWKDPNSEIISPEEVIEGCKVYVIVKLYIAGFSGPKTSTGVSETDDENSITTAEAQAFKRSCSMVNIGKYLYFLPKFTCKYSYGKIQDPPQLPDWAIPVTYCEDCAGAIRTTQFKAKDDTVQSWNPIEIVKRSQQHFGKNLCMDCMRTRREKKTGSDVDARLKKPAESALAAEQTQAAA